MPPLPSTISYHHLDLNSTALTTLARAVLDSTHIIAVAHRKPDGDTIGAGAALRAALTPLGKQVDLFAIDPLPQQLQLLPHAHAYSNVLPSSTPDLIVVLDTHNPAQTGIAPYLMEHQDRCFILDHHQPLHTPKLPALIQQESPSTTLLLTAIFELFAIPICPDTATNLLAGLYWDTGCLKHNNTSALAYRTAAQLLSLGAKHQWIMEQVFSPKPVPHLQLLGRALQRLSWHPTKQFTYSILTEEDMADTGASSEDILGIIDYMNTIPEQLFTLLLAEEQGYIKGSLRSIHQHIDLSRIAASFGGGGHAQAAGFTLRGQLEKYYHWSLQPLLP